MTITTRAPVVGSSDEEVARVVALEEELCRARPDVDQTELKTRVDRVWASYRTAPVRDFVPLLVRRQVLDELTRAGDAHTP